MAKDIYFLITSSEDGITISYYNEAERGELLEEVRENNKCFGWKVTRDLPLDLNNYHRGMWIIKGKTVGVVSRLDIED